MTTERAQTIGHAALKAFRERREDKGDSAAAADKVPNPFPPRYEHALSPLPRNQQFSLSLMMGYVIQVEYPRQLRAMMESDEPFESLYFAADYADLIPGDMEESEKAKVVRAHWHRVAERINPIELSALLYAVEEDVLRKGSAA